MMENGKERNAAAHNQVDRFIKERGYVHDQEGMVPVKVLFADFREWQEEAGMAGLTFIDFETGVRGVTGSSRRYIETGGKKQFVIAGIRKGEMSEDYITWMGIELPVMRTEDQTYVIMRQIAGPIGLWDNEEDNIQFEGKYDPLVITMNSPIGLQQEVCLPFEQFVHWFLHINPDDVFCDVKELIVSRQNNCVCQLTEQTEDVQSDMAEVIRLADGPPYGLQPQKVEFMGLGLPVVDIDDRAHVVMDMVFEIWDLTHPELRRQILTSDTLDDITVTVKTISGPQDQLCIPFTQFSQWLRTVDVEMVRPGIREIVMFHQDICYAALQEEQMIRAGSKMDEHQEIETEMKEENKMQELEIDQAVTTETHTPEAIEFMGMDLPSVEIDYQTYVVMKPVVESFGLAWSDQSRKLKSSKRFRSCIKCVVTNGGPQKMVCIPLTQFDCWLMSINPEKAHPENRDRLIAEQERLLNAKRETEMQEQKNHKEVTTETHTPEAVEFMGKQLLGIKVDDQVYVPMKPVVEGMGLDWKSQHRKINRRFGQQTMPLQTPGGPQKMSCIPLTKLNGWLYSINPDRVRPDLRETVIAYQEECHIALYNYFNKGAAINPDMLTEEKKEEIVDAVKKAGPAQVEEEPRENSVMKDEQVEEMLADATRKEGTPDQVKEALNKIADTVNYSQFPARTDCDHFRFDEKAIFQLVYQALQNLDDPLSPESIKTFKMSYCVAARYMIPRLAQGIIHHMQVEGVLEKGC